MTDQSIDSQEGDRAKEARIAKKMVRRKRRDAAFSIGLAIAGPLLAMMTYLTLSHSDPSALTSWWFRLLILADVCYLVLLAALIGLRLTHLFIARRARSAGARLHTRMVAFFIGIAAAPAILVAIFFFLVLQLGLEAWFNDQVSFVVRNSRQVAQAYAREHQASIQAQAAALAAELNKSLGDEAAAPFDKRLQRVVARATEAWPFSDIYVLNSSGEILARGEYSFTFAFTPPTIQEITTAEEQPLIIEDSAANEMRALVRLESIFDAYLYVTRPVDGEVLEMLARTNAAAETYDRLEKNRETWLAQFAALYLGFAMIVLMAAIYLGLWFAERLAKPVGRLAAAAQKVRDGDLYARVKEEQGQDEISLLSRVFNRMTEEVKRKQDALSAAHEEAESRRRFSEAVLAGVSSGVVGLDAHRCVVLMNHSAAQLLGLNIEADAGRPFESAAPEFKTLLERVSEPGVESAEAPLRILRDGVEHELLARVAMQQSDETPNGVAGYVVTIDDLTALVSAQRMAAWADVARRIAHEIKNPLTPIRLAAERLRRKFSNSLGEHSETFDRYTETIIRQTGEIGRMVDAFSRFAKMPSPKMAHENVVLIMREAYSLQKDARPHVQFDFTSAQNEVVARCDRGQLGQAFTNLLQNAVDAINSRLELGEEGAPPEVRVRIDVVGNSLQICVDDNGVGLPKHDRRRLLEPYVTTREKGTGLGLAIVLKIVEDHGGEFALLDAPAFAAGAHRGARARITLPLSQQRPDQPLAEPQQSAVEENAAATS